MEYSKAKEKPVSKVYWFKCWRENPSGCKEAVWRFSLEDPNAGERVGFASLEGVLAYVKTALAEAEREV